MPKPPDFRKAACCINCEYGATIAWFKCVKHNYSVDIVDTCADFIYSNKHIDVRET